MGLLRAVDDLFHSFNENNIGDSGFGSVLHLDISGVFALSTGSKVVYLEYEDVDDLISHHSLQYIYVVSVLYSLKMDYVDLGLTIR